MKSRKLIFVGGMNPWKISCICEGKVLIYPWKSSFQEYGFWQGFNPCKKKKKTSQMFRRKTHTYLNLNKSVKLPNTIPRKWPFYKLILKRCFLKVITSYKFWPLFCKIDHSHSFSNLVFVRGCPSKNPSVILVQIPLDPFLISFTRHWNYFTIFFPRSYTFCYPKFIYFLYSFIIPIF